MPESLAYATIAGVPPVVGLYAAVPALLLYALLGSSRHLVVASMSATAALSAGIVGDLADGGSDRYVALTHPARPRPRPAARHPRDRAPDRPETRDVLRRAAASTGVTLDSYPDVDAAVAAPAGTAGRPGG